MRRQLSGDRVWFSSKQEVILPMSQQKSSCVFSLVEKTVLQFMKSQAESKSSKYLGTFILHTFVNVLQNAFCIQRICLLENITDFFAIAVKMEEKDTANVYPKQQLRGGRILLKLGLVSYSFILPVRS